MNDYPEQNKREPSEPRSTGNFKVNIDERDLAADNYDPGQQGYDPGGYSGETPYNRSFATDEERRAEMKAHKKRNRLKARKNKRVFSLVWICMVLLASFTLASYLIGGSNDFFAVGRGEGTAQIEVPDRVDAETLTELLYAGGAIKKKEFFKLYCSVTVDDDEWEWFQPGSYEIPTNLDYEDLINTLQGGNETAEVVTVTFPEGVTALEAAKLLADNEVCTQEEFLEALNGDFSNYTAIAALGDTSGKYYKLEGYLFPDTYDFYKGEEIQSVVGKMLHNFEEKMSDSTLALVEQSGYTLDQIITMASIIQGEAANASDMYDVSAVLHNRLDFGADNDIFFLECDSTTYYPYKNAEEVPASGALPYGNYNTYSTGVRGLPAGAICNPGIDAIQAALNPSDDGDAPNWLYFCHSADGVSYFASTSWEHQENLVAAGLVDSGSGDDWDDGGDDWDDGDDW